MFNDELLFHYYTSITSTIRLYEIMYLIKVTLLSRVAYFPYLRSSNSCHVMYSKAPP